MIKSIQDSDGAESKRGDALRKALETELGDAPARPSVPPAPRVPDHKLLRRIGIGAYGEVWVAQNTLGTLRAVKVLYRDRFEEERPYLREFQGILNYEPISRTHPGLVQVLHVGKNEEAGYFYYVMELADDAGGKTAPRSSPDRSPTPSGNASTSADSDPAKRRVEDEVIAYRPKTLRGYLARGSRLEPIEATELALRLADALAHLHDRGLVHRDIKPSNVIFVAGVPKLADIGLVTGAGDSRSFVGTEGFIPPEGPGTIQADLYGLGKLLYEMVTGRDRMDFPQLPPDVVEGAGGHAVLELNEVITRACAPGLQDRYANARTMMADLNLFLSGRGLREARKLERHVRVFRRLAIAAGLSLLFAGTLAWFAESSVREAREGERISKERARRESSLRTRAETAEHEVQAQLYTALLEQARAVVRSREMGHRIRALEAIHKAGAISNSPDLRAVAFEALGLADLNFERTLPISPGTTMVELDSCFERVASCSGTGPVEIRSATGNQLLATFPASTNLKCFSGGWSADCQFLAVRRDLGGFGGNTELEVWSVFGKRQMLLLHNVPHGAFSFHPTRPELLVANGETSAQLLSVEDGIRQAEFPLPAQPRILSFSPDGSRFAVISDEADGSTLLIHRVNPATLLLTVHIPPEKASSLCWHPSGNCLGVSDFGGGVRLIDAQTGESRMLGRHKFSAVTTTFCPDGRFLLSGGWERELRCWDLQAPDGSFTIGMNSFTARFGKDGREAALSTELGLQICGFEAPACHRALPEDLGGDLRRGVISPNGRWLAVAGADQLGVWDLDHKGPAAMSDQGADCRLFFSPESDELFASREKECYHWRLAPGVSATSPPELLQVPLEYPPGFTSLCLASNQLVFTTTNGSFMVPRDQSIPGQPQMHPAAYGVSTASPDGRWLTIYRPFRETLHIYRLPDITPVAILTNRAAIGTVSFSPRGDEVAVGSRRWVSYWSTRDWHQTREITNFTGVLYPSKPGPCWLSIDFRKGGLYDSPTLGPVLPLPSGTLPLALSPDGRKLVVSVDLRRLQVWDLGDLRNSLRELGIDWPDS